MKTTEKKQTKKFHAVDYMRQQRDKLSERLSKMTKEEILNYFKEISKGKEIKPSA